MPNHQLLARWLLAVAVLSASLPPEAATESEATKAEGDPLAAYSQSEAFTYPPATEQREAVRQMSDAIRQMQPGEHDVMLRRVLERCSVSIAEEFWTELQNSTSAPAELRKNTSALLKRLREIREFDEKSTPEFVSQAVAAKNPSALGVAIFALRTEELQGSAAKGLGELGDPVAVRCLALRLRQAASLSSGGAEQQMSRIQLRKSLIATLSAVTEIEMTVDGSEDAANKALEATQVWSVKQTGKNQSSINLEQRLKGVQQGTVSNEPEEKIKAVREARDTGSPEHIPSLLQIAQIYAEPRKDAENLPWPVRDANLAFEALDAADALGDIKQELLSYAQDHKRRMYLACCAIRILGRDADAGLMAKLEKIHEKSTHNYVRGAVSEARTAFTVNRHLKGLETPREQTAFVLSRFGCDWNPIVEVTQESESRKKPVYVWSQNQLLRLSKLYPAEVARAVHDLEYASTMDAVYNRSFREYVVNHFLSKEAKIDFRKLEQN